MTRSERIAQCQDVMAKMQRQSMVVGVGWMWEHGHGVRTELGPEWPARTIVGVARERTNTKSADKRRICKEKLSGSNSHYPSALKS